MGFALARSGAVSGVGTETASAKCKIFTARVSYDETDYGIGKCAFVHYIYIGPVLNGFNVRVRGYA